jgi:hypothetical protein
MLMTKKIVLAVAMLDWMVLAEGRSDAEYIAFTIQGTGFVAVPNSSYETEQVSITLVGDTDNAGSLPSLGPVIGNFSGIEYSVQGQGNFFSADTPFVSMANFFAARQYQIELSGFPFSTDDFSYSSNSPLSTYALNTSLAPVALGNLQDLLIDPLQGGGDINLMSLTGVTFSASTSVSVPEPSAAALLGVASMVLAVAQVRRLTGRSLSRAGNLEVRAVNDRLAHVATVFKNRGS